MKIGVLAEEAPGEKRVAISPDSVRAYRKKGVEVAIEAGAGAGSFISDQVLAEAGAKTVSAAEAVKDADVILTVRRPEAKALASARTGALVVGLMEPYGDVSGLSALAEQGLTVLALELLPRITRAQAMDVLSSQANLAGYKAVIDAAEQYYRAFPMMMTAAGTVPPARVFVMGAGVAGLQAIATARRLGAVVSATDVRAAAAEQVQSLGAKFIFVEGLKDAATQGGYAKELSEDDRKKQAALIAEHLKSQDIVVTTALIPGRSAPVLITKEMAESMKAGSVIVDLAVERGGNCALSEAGKIVEHRGVTIMGLLNLPSRLAGNASMLYAKNLQNFLDLVISKEGTLAVNWEDEIIKETLVARDGKIVHRLLLAQGAQAS
jgi:proton-translocating NAD(P)+ transhydrogenase subunit alpha